MDQHSILEQLGQVDSDEAGRTFREIVRSVPGALCQSAAASSAGYPSLAARRVRQNPQL